MAIRTAAINLLIAYKRFVSPFLPPACRFTPSCSEYARAAIEVHGVTFGAWLALRRLLRCHPFHPGGFDAVPERVLRDRSVASPSRQVGVISGDFAGNAPAGGRTDAG